MEFSTEIKLVFVFLLIYYNNGNVHDNEHFGHHSFAATLKIIVQQGKKIR